LCVGSARKRRKKPAQRKLLNQRAQAGMAKAAEAVRAEGGEPLVKIVLKQKKTRSKRMQDLEKEVCDELGDPLHFMPLREIWEHDKLPSPIEQNKALHMKHHVQMEMAKFDKEQADLNLELSLPCVCCHRLWFHSGPAPNPATKMCRECSSDIGYFCQKCATLLPNEVGMMEKRCSWCKNNHTLTKPQLPKKFSIFNDMQPGPIPAVLQGLTEVEEMLIALCLPIMRVHYKTFSRREYSGHVINIRQDVRLWWQKLPRKVEELPILFIKRYVGHETFKLCKVERERVRDALNWKFANDPAYKLYSEIDETRYDALPTNGVPPKIREIIVQAKKAKSAEASTQKKKQDEATTKKKKKKQRRKSKRRSDTREEKFSKMQDSDDEDYQADDDRKEDDDDSSDSESSDLEANDSDHVPTDHSITDTYEKTPFLSLQWEDEHTMILTVFQKRKYLY